MSEFNDSDKQDLSDPLVRQLSAMRPSEPDGFAFRVIYSAGRADAFREFAARRGQRLWLNAAAILILVAGSSAWTWEISRRDMRNGNNIASVGQPAESVAVAAEDKPAVHSQPVVQPNSRVAADQSLNQLVDRLLSRHQASTLASRNFSDRDSSSESTQPVSVSPSTWMQLQQRLRNGSSVF